MRGSQRRYQGDARKQQRRYQGDARKQPSQKAAT
jgi:hypothetical protein